MNLTEWISTHEEWLQNQISRCADEFVFGYDLFFDPNDWVPIPELSKALISIIQNPSPPHRELPLDEDFLETGASSFSGEILSEGHFPGKKSSDPVAPLVKTYTLRSLQEGTPPALFLSMLKCYRRCYIKLIHSAGFEKSITGYFHRRVADFFDRFEILSSIVWVKAGAVLPENPSLVQPSLDSIPVLTESIGSMAVMEQTSPIPPVFSAPPSALPTALPSAPSLSHTGLGIKTGLIDQLVEGITYEINQPLQNISEHTLTLQKDFAVVATLLESYHDLLAALKTGAATPESVLEVEQEVKRAELESIVESIPGLFRQLAEGAERATKIVGAMKEFWRTRIDEDINININRVLENVLIITRNKWRFVAEIQSDLDPNLPVILGMPGDFNQLILNLIIHSIYSIAEALNSGTMAKGLIKISTGIAADGIEIRIRNNGKPVWEIEMYPEALNLDDMDEQEQEILNRWLASREMVIKKYGGSLAMEADGKETAMVIRLPLKAE